VSSNRRSREREERHRGIGARAHQTATSSSRPGEKWASARAEFTQLADEFASTRRGRPLDGGARPGCGRLPCRESLQHGTHRRAGTEVGEWEARLAAAQTQAPHRAELRTTRADKEAAAATAATARQRIEELERESLQASRALTEARVALDAAQQEARHCQERRRGHRQDACRASGPAERQPVLVPSRAGARERHHQAAFTRLRALRARTPALPSTRGGRRSRTQAKKSWSCALEDPGGTSTGSPTICGQGSWVLRGQGARTLLTSRLRSHQTYLSTGEQRILRDGSRGCPAEELRDRAVLKLKARGSHVGLAGNDRTPIALTSLNGPRPPRPRRCQIVNHQIQDDKSTSVERPENGPSASAWI